MNAKKLAKQYTISVADRVVKGRTRVEYLVTRRPVGLVARFTTRAAAEAWIDEVTGKDGAFAQG
jgi:hypothetical protein